MEKRGTRNKGGRTAKQPIADRIVQGIRSGRYVPGQRLIEADLMEEFRSTRGPVREALRILAGDGIVELVSGKGARVKKLERDDLVELFPVLTGLLDVTVRLAIPRLAEAPWRERLDSAMEALRRARALEDYGQFQLAGIRYADLLMDAAANRYLIFLNAKLHPNLFYRQVTSVVHIDDWVGYLNHFESLHRALLDGDLPECRRLLAEHEDRMQEAFRQGGEEVHWT